jgi:hypothetical protein
MRYLFCLVLGLATVGCAGKNTVAGEDKTKAEQLEGSLPTWCQSTCERIDACSAPDCDCQGDTCNCDTGAKCPAQCEEEMARFTDGTEACATVGENFKRCIDTMTCEEFNGNGKCELSAADKKLCPEMEGDTIEPSPAGGGQVPGGGGSGPVPSDNPGSAGTTGGTAGATVTCGSGYGTGGAGSAEPSASAVICEEGLADCNDGHEYSWICARGSEGQLGCSCFVDSQVTGGFDPQSSSCPSRATVNAGCHWNIAL